jgi:multidrug efflux pump subunit AcrB
MLLPAFALSAGSQMLQPVATAVNKGLSLSIFLSLAVTSVIYYNITQSIHRKI